jgi:NADH:ubiquinone oxidoreductase subunit 4 (subunit M)
MEFVFLKPKNTFFTNILVAHLFFKNKTIEKRENGRKINDVYKGIFRGVNISAFFTTFNFMNSLFSPPISI